MFDETASSDGTRLDIHRFGYGYSHLDPYGRLSDSRTCSLTSFGLNPDFMDDVKLKEDGREYYSLYFAKLNTAKLDPKTLLYRKVWIEKELVHVGNTSFATHSVLKCPERQNILADSYYVSVHIDKETRQKRELPKWFKNKYGHLKESPISFESPDVPHDWCCKAKVHASDTDSNQHANFSVYITFSQNAVYKYEKAHSNLTWLENHSLAEISIKYLGDSKQGDELTLWVLKQPKLGETYFVNIEKDGVIKVKVKLSYTSVQSGNLWSNL